MAAAAATTVILLLLTISTTTSAAPISTGFIRPNFTASHYKYIDTSGDFLQSPNHTYTAAIFNPQSSSPLSFYLVIYHTDSHTVVWTANRNTPISNSGEFHLSLNGITINNDSSQLVWSTPIIKSTVYSLQLLDSGNLVLLDHLNNTLWQSFDYPTDTVVSGQRLQVGQLLIASKSPADLSGGDYSFTVTSSDGILQWRNASYYRLLMDSKSIKNSNRPVSYVTVNGSGFYLFGDRGLEVVIQVLIDAPVDDDSGYRILKITNDGNLAVMRYVNNNWVTDFNTPADSCRIPYRCGKLGLCSANQCSCPSGFRSDLKTNFGCSFSDPTLLWPESPESCFRRSNVSDNYVYVKLGDGMKYFEIDYLNPVKSGLTVSKCEDLCSGNCTCLGFFHGNLSGSCYLIENNLGSIISSSNNDSDDKLGFIKAVNPSSLSPYQGGNSSNDFPTVGLVLLPTSGVLLIMICALCMNRRSRNARQMRANARKKLTDNSFSDELEMFSIAGLPVRFDHQDIILATANFSTRIGSGGFGTVYKGILRDKTVVAVKKITALGAQGKKEFGTEIAIIGNIHHVNLVKLRGFCSYGRERYLVYEYMSRGSLDRTIFGSGPPLEWQERFEIAVGMARGLAYLHNGCEHKIIHCDVKPENILLSENMQVKISDFGLSKLLSPEQSGLFTTMRGTRGYLAPEWLTNAAISDKTDVYSYGMVLLELIQGRKNCVQVPTYVSGRPNRNTNPSSSTEERSSGSPAFQTRSRTRAFYFPLHALEMHEAGRYLDLVDPKLAGRVTNEEAEKLVKVALCCLHEDQLLRPTMANVVAMLEGTSPVGEPRLELLNFLRFYGRRFSESSNAETGVEVELPSGFMVPNIDSSSSSVSRNSFSYMSSQQVSGPR